MSGKDRKEVSASQSSRASLFQKIPCNNPHKQGYVSDGELIKAFEGFFKEGNEVNEFLGKKKTWLSYCAEHGRCDTVSYLLGKGAGLVIKEEFNESQHVFEKYKKVVHALNLHDCELQKPPRWLILLEQQEKAFKLIWNILKELRALDRSLSGFRSLKADKDKVTILIEGVHALKRTVGLSKNEDRLRPSKPVSLLKVQDTLEEYRIKLEVMKGRPAIQSRMRALVSRIASLKDDSKALVEPLNKVDSIIAQPASDLGVINDILSELEARIGIKEKITRALKHETDKDRVGLLKDISKALNIPEGSRGRDSNDLLLLDVNRVIGDTCSIRSRRSTLSGLTDFFRSVGASSPPAIDASNAQHKAPC